MPSWQTPGGGLTKAANDKLYKADPSMHGKSKEDRTKRYKELFGEEQDVKEIENIPFQTKQMVRKHPMD
jgi:hypothetical protein